MSYDSLQHEGARTLHPREDEHSAACTRNCKDHGAGVTA